MHWHGSHDWLSGEEEADFQETCETFLSGPFSYCHVFTYSERDGTASQRLSNQVPMEIRRKRSSKLRSLSASKKMDWHQNQIGKVFNVLIENPKNGMYAGYTENYLKIMIGEDHPELANKFARVRVKEAMPEYCLGELIEFDS